jgi:hypothetical protein
VLEAPGEMFTFLRIAPWVGAREQDEFMRRLRAELPTGRQVVQRYGQACIRFDRAMGPIEAMFEVQKLITPIRAELGFDADDITCRDEPDWRAV